MEIKEGSVNPPSFPENAIYSVEDGKIKIGAPKKLNQDVLEISFDPSIVKSAYHISKFRFWFLIVIYSVNYQNTIILVDDKNLPIVFLKPNIWTKDARLAHILREIKRSNTQFKPDDLLEDSIRELNFRNMGFKFLKQIFLNIICWVLLAGILIYLSSQL